MTSSKIQKYEKPVVEEKKTPQEVLRMQTLLDDNWWKDLIKRIDETIKQSTKDLRKPLPLWLSNEQKQIRYDDLERIKMKLECYEELKQLPYTIMSEYWEEFFNVDMSDWI